MKKSDLGMSTRMIHAGEPSPRIGGSATVPIFQSSVFEFDADGDTGMRYPRFGNLPNQEAVAKKVADLEGAEEGLVTSSGMSACSTMLLAVLAPGDHVLVQDSGYGGLYPLLADLRAFGIEHDLIDACRPETWKAKLEKSTRMIYTEAISNPLIRVADHPAVVAFAKANGLVAGIDATVASPVNFRPIAAGYDVLFHSATKYLNGHSDLVAGVICGRADILRRARTHLVHFGGCLDPHACFLLHRGLKTLTLRVERQNASALAVARFLEKHPRVTQTNYCGLESSPDHARARELLRGFGGLLSFELKGDVAAAERMLARLELFVIGPSLGGVESLAQRPAVTSHSYLSPEARARMGVPDNLVRLSIGVEDVEDLIADVDAALN